MHTKRFISALVPALLLAAPAAATEIFDNSVSTCTGANCSSQVIGGTVTTSAGNAHPWVIEVYARAGECVRLHVLQQAVDLELTATTPNGTVFRNDDGGVAPCALCSLVKFSAPNTGWNTVQISHFAGTAVHSDLQLAYGRYNGGNANCAAPTPPAAAAAAERTAKNGASVAITGNGTAR